MKVDHLKCHSSQITLVFWYIMSLVFLLQTYTCKMECYYEFYFLAIKKKKSFNLVMHISADVANDH